MIKRIRIALVALLVAFAIAFNAGPLASFFGGFACNTAVALFGTGIFDHPPPGGEVTAGRP